MRAFVGLPLPDPVADALDAVAQALPAGRTVDCHNLHLTLAFLDDQPEQLLEALHDRLAALDWQAPRIVVTHLDLFGGATPRLIAAAVARDPALDALRDKVRGAARHCGIDLPRERFRPHVTLARLRGRPAPDMLARLQAAAGTRLDTVPPFSAHRLALFRSTLGPEGADYDILADYPAPSVPQEFPE